MEIKGITLNDTNNKNKPFKYDKFRASKLYNDVSLKNVEFDALTFDDKKTVLQYSVDEGLDNYEDFKSDVVKNYGLKRPTLSNSTSFNQLDNKVDYGSMESNKGDTGAFFGSKVSYLNTPEENARISKGDKLDDDLFTSVTKKLFSGGSAFYDNPVDIDAGSNITSSELFNNGSYKAGVRKENEEKAEKENSVLNTPYGKMTYKDFVDELEKKNNVGAKFVDTGMSIKEPIETVNINLTSENKDKPAPKPFDYMTNQEYMNTKGGLDIMFKPKISAQVQVLSNGQIDREATARARKRFEELKTENMHTGGDQKLLYREDGSVDTERMRNLYKTELSKPKDANDVLDEWLEGKDDNFMEDDKSIFSLDAINEAWSAKKIQLKKSELEGKIAFFGETPERLKMLAKLDVFMEDHPEMNTSEARLEYREEHGILSLPDKAVTGLVEQASLWTNNSPKKISYTILGNLLGSAKAGYMASTWEDMFFIEGGSAYREMRDAGVPHDIAKNKSAWTGAINATTEVGQQLLFLATSGLNKATSTVFGKGTKVLGSGVGKSAIDKIFDKFAGKVLEKTGSKVASKLAEVTARGLASGLGEMNQEGWQALNSEYQTNKGVNLAVDRGFIDPKEARNYEVSDYAKVYFDEVKAVAPTMILLGFLGVGGSQTAESLYQNYKEKDNKENQLYIAKSMNELKEQSFFIGKNPEKFVHKETKAKLIQDIDNYIEFAKKERGNFEAISESELGFNSTYDEAIDLLENYKKYIQDIEQVTRDKFETDINFELQEGKIENAEQALEELNKVADAVGMKPEEMAELKEKIETEKVERSRFINNMADKNVGEIKTKFNDNKARTEVIKGELETLNSTIEQTESKAKTAELENERASLELELEKIQDENVVMSETIQKKANGSVVTEGRDLDSIGSRSVKALQNIYPELKPFIQEQAVYIREEFSEGIKGHRYPILAERENGKAGPLEQIGYDGTQRIASETATRILDETNSTYEKIEQAFDDIIEGNKKSNYALAKRIEFILDDVLTNGYQTLTGVLVPPNQEYINAKKNIETQEFATQKQAVEQNVSVEGQAQNEKQSSQSETAQVEQTQAGTELESQDSLAENTSSKIDETIQKLERSAETLENIKKIRIPDSIDKNKPVVFRAGDADEMRSPSEQLQGLYVTPALTKDYVYSPHMEAGSKGTFANISYKNPLNVNSVTITNERFGELEEGVASAGVTALHEMVGEDKFNELNEMSKSELEQEIKSEFDVEAIDYHNYDVYELLEVYGGQLARRQGYDVIIQIDYDTPAMSEYVLLEDSVLENVQPMEQAQPESQDSLAKITSSELSNAYNEAFTADMENESVEVVSGNEASQIEALAQKTAEDFIDGRINKQSLDEAYARIEERFDEVDAEDFQDNVEERIAELEAVGNELEIVEEDKVERASIGERLFNKMNQSVELGAKVKQLNEKMLEKGVSQQEIDGILEDYFDVIQGFQDAGISNFNFDLEVVDKITDLMDEKMLKEHGFESGEFATVDGVSLVNSNIANKSIKSAIELVSLPKKPIGETFIHELAEMYGEIWRIENPESFQQVVDELVDKGLATEDNYQEYIADYLTDSALEKRLDLTDEQSTVTSMVGEYVAKFKNWASGIIERIDQLRSDRKNAPDLLNKQAEMFANGQWKEAIEMYQKAQKTIENSDSNELRVDLEESLSEGNIAYEELVDKFGFHQEPANVFMEKLMNARNKESGKETKKTIDMDYKTTLEITKEFNNSVRKSFFSAYKGATPTVGISMSDVNKGKSTQIELNLRTDIKRAGADYVYKENQNESGLTKKELVNSEFEKLKNILDEKGIKYTVIKDIMTKKVLSIDNVSADILGETNENVEDTESLNVDEINEMILNYYDNMISSKQNVKFSMAEDEFYTRDMSVDDAGNLMFVHGIKEDVLIKALDFGALPMPSIAVMKTDQKRNSFGSISLIGSKYFFDPARTNTNKIFDTDVYSPNFPPIGENVDENFVQEVYKMVEEYEQYQGSDFYLDDIFDYSDTYALNNRMKSSNALMAKYLKETFDVEVEPVMKSQFKNVSGSIVRLERAGMDVYEEFVKEAKKEGYYSIEAMIGDMDFGGRAEDKRFAMKVTEKITRGWIENNIHDLLDMKDSKKLSQEELNQYIETLTINKDYNVITFLKAVKKSKEESEILNPYATKDALTKALKENDAIGLFRSYIRTMIDENITERFFEDSNGKKLEVTPENALKLMKTQRLVNGESSIFHSPANMKASLATQFKSLKQIRDASYKLDDVQDYTTEPVANEAVYSFVEKYDIYNDRQTGANLVIDNVVEHGVDAGFKSLLEQTEKMQENKTQARQDFDNMVETVINAPVQYFEMKPTRIVGFDEFNYAIIPADVQATTENRLKQLGYNVVKYDGTDAGYVEALKATNGDTNVRFSVERASEAVDIANETSQMLDDVIKSTDEMTTMDFAKVELDTIEAMRKIEDTLSYTRKSDKKTEFLNRVNYIKNTVDYYHDSIVKGADARMLTEGLLRKHKIRLTSVKDMIDDMQNEGLNLLEDGWIDVGHPINRTIAREFDTLKHLKKLQRKSNTDFSERISEIESLMENVMPEGVQTMEQMQDYIDSLPMTKKSMLYNTRFSVNSVNENDMKVENADKVFSNEVIDGEYDPSLIEKKHFNNLKNTKLLLKLSESKVRDEYGNPLLTFHASTHKITAGLIDTKRSNPDNAIGKGFYASSKAEDSIQNYLSEGKDLEHRKDGLFDELSNMEDFELEELAEREGIDLSDYDGDPETLIDMIVENELVGDGEYLYPVYLDIKNPFVIDPSGKEGDVLTLEYEEYTMDSYENWQAELEELEKLEKNFNYISENEPESPYLEGLQEEIEKQQQREEDFREGYEGEAMYAEYSGEVYDIIDTIVYELKYSDTVEIYMGDGEIDQAQSNFYEALEAYLTPDNPRLEFTGYEVYTALIDSFGSIEMKFMEDDTMENTFGFHEIIRRGVEEAGFDGARFVRADTQFNLEMPYGTDHYVAFKRNQVIFFNDDVGMDTLVKGKNAYKNINFDKYKVKDHDAWIEKTMNSDAYKFGEKFDIVEMVDVEYLEKFKEFDREMVHNNSEESALKLVKSLSEEGMREPIMMMYDDNTKSAFLGEGNNRLMIAKKLGIKKVPVKGVPVSHKSHVNNYQIQNPIWNSEKNKSGGFKVSDIISESELKKTARQNYNLRFSVAKVDEFVANSVNAYDGQIDMINRAMINGESVGSVEYSIYNGEIFIQMIKVPEANRRQKIAHQLLYDLQQSNPDKNINYGGLTEDGSGLLGSISVKEKSEYFDDFEKMYALEKELMRLEASEYDSLSQEELDSWNPKQTELDILMNELRNKPKYREVVQPVEQTVKPSSGNWNNGASYEQVLKQYPDLNSKTTEGEKGHSTQIKTTLGTYQKTLKEFVKPNTKTLDFSAGLGYGTRYGKFMNLKIDFDITSGKVILKNVNQKYVDVLKENGYKKQGDRYLKDISKEEESVYLPEIDSMLKKLYGKFPEDVTTVFDASEPFPADYFNPDYKDSKEIPSNAYDLVVNNAVLNVVPQDIRNEIVSEIGRVLKSGGKAIIMTRGRSEIVNSATGLKIEGGDKYARYFANKTSYQKGFSKTELLDYVKDVLEQMNPDAEFEVEKLNSKNSDTIANKNGVVVTKMGKTIDFNEKAENNGIPVRPDPLPADAMFEMNEDMYDAKMRTWEAYEKSFTDYARKRFNEGNVLTIKSNSNESDYAIIHPYTKSGEYAYQVSYFDKAGPYADGSFKTLDNAISRLFDNGYNDAKKISSANQLRFSVVNEKVGKKIGYTYYIHKSAIDTLTAEQKRKYDKAIQYVPKSFGNFEIIKFNKKKDYISFINSPDWNESHEPIVTNSILVRSDGSYKIRKGSESNPKIYHHKHLFVKENYDGFNVEESRLRSAIWENFDVNKKKIGSKKYWDENVIPMINDEIARMKADDNYNVPTEFKENVEQWMIDHMRFSVNEDATVAEQELAVSKNEAKTVDDELRQLKADIIRLEDAVEDNPNLRYELRNKRLEYFGLGVEKISADTDYSFTKLVNEWFKSKDLEQLRSTVKIRNLQKEIKKIAKDKTVFGRVYYGEKAKKLDQAIQIYIDLMGQEDEMIEKYYDKLTDEQKEIVDLSQNLPNEAKIVADEILAISEEIGLRGLSAGVLKNLRENHLSRIWQSDKDENFNNVSHASFTRKTNLAKQRTLESILEGWAKNKKLSMTGATTALDSQLDSLVNAIENNRMIESMMNAVGFEGEPLLITYRVDGYSEITHPNFNVWQPVNGNYTKKAFDFNKAKEGQWVEVDGKMGKLGSFDKNLIKNQVNLDGEVKEITVPVIFNAGKDNEVTEQIRPRNLEKVSASGANFFVDEKDTIWERKRLYAPDKVAKRLNTILDKSKLYDVEVFGKKPFAWLTSTNAMLKSWILQTSFFHHLAFMRSYYLGTNNKKASELNFWKAYKNGISEIENMSEDIELLVANGMTLGRMQDWEERAFFNDKGRIAKLLDKTKATRVIKDKILEMRERQANFLFKEFGAGLKAQSGLIELRHMRHKYAKELESGQVTQDKIAEVVGNLLNNDFGGLHLQRLERDATFQHVMKLALLAPDWTESNVRTMVEMFSKDKMKADISRRFWINALAKGIAFTGLMNLFMAMVGKEDDEDTLEKFMQSYKDAWRAGNLRWTAVDITPLYELASENLKDDRYYFSLIGHFKDVLKFTAHPVRSLNHKGSAISRIGQEALTGEDWRGWGFSTTGDYFGLSEHSTLGKTLGATTADGKYKGQTTHYGGGGSIGWNNVVPYITHQIISNQPIQVQNFVEYRSGQLSPLEAVANSAGLDVRKSYVAPAVDKFEERWDKLYSEHKIYNDTDIAPEGYRNSVYNQVKDYRSRISSNEREMEKLKLPPEITAIEEKINAIEQSGRSRDIKERMINGYEKRLDLYKERHEKNADNYEKLINNYQKKNNLLYERANELLEKNGY